MTSHPANGLDDIVHQRVRLGILTIAHEARRVEFSYLRDTLELTAGNLSQHLGVLETAGLIAIEKGYAGKRARTWVTLTKAGAGRTRGRDRPAQTADQPHRAGRDAAQLGPSRQATRGGVPAAKSSAAWVPHPVPGHTGCLWGLDTSVSYERYRSVAGWQGQKPT